MMGRWARALLTTPSRYLTVQSKRIPHSLKQPHTALLPCLSAAWARRNARLNLSRRRTDGRRPSHLVDVDEIGRRVAVRVGLGGHADHRVTVEHLERLGSELVDAHDSLAMQCSHLG